MPLTTGKATDLITLSRGTLATVTDSDGKIKWAPHNLLTNSEQFDSGNWPKTNTTVAANALVAPNGTTTADTVTTSDVNSLMYQAVGVIPGAAYIFAFWAKRGTMTDAKLSVYDTNGFNVIAPTSYYASTNASEWTLITQAFTAPASCTQVYVYPLRSSNVTGTIHLWGAHLYRSDLGGMQANASAYPMYNPSTLKNLLGYSEDLSAVGWTNSATTITKNATTAPNGSSTANKIVATATLAYHARYVVIAVGSAVYTLSIYAKAAEYSLLHIGDRVGATYGAAFDLVSGTVVAGTTGGAKYVSSAIAPVGNGWYRCSVVFSNLSGNAGPTFVGYPSGAMVDNIGAQYTGDGTSGIYLWGAQLSDSASLDAYVPSFGAAPSAAAYHGPRLDYDPVTLSARGLLVEEATANLLIDSNAMATNWSSDGGATFAANSTISPTGLTDATQLQFGTTAYFYRSLALSATPYTLTLHVKKGTGGNSTIKMGIGSLPREAVFNLDTGVASSVTGTSAKMTAVGNSWWRCELVFTPTAATHAIAVEMLGSFTSGQGHYFWGIQLEAKSFATSYVPNKNTALGVTRNADVASVGVSQFPYSSSAGSVIVNCSLMSTAVSGAFNLTSRSDNSGTLERFQIRTASGAATLYVANGGNGPFGTGGVAIDGGTIALSGYKAAAALQANDAVLVVNGAVAGTDTSSVTVPSMDILRLGACSATSEHLNGWLRQITYIPRRLTNAELQARTA